MRSIGCVLICSALLIAHADAEPPKLAKVQLGDLWGFLDAKGNYVVEPQFDAVESFSGGLAAVRLDGLWGFIDAKGNYVLKPQFSGIKPIAAGWTAVAQRGKWGIIDAKGNYVLKPQFSGIKPIAAGWIAVAQGGKWGIMDAKGNYVVKPQFDEIGTFSGGVLAVRQGRKWGFIDAKGNYVFRPALDRLEWFADGWILAAQVVAFKEFWGLFNFQWGITNWKNKVIRVKDENSAKPVSPSLVAVRRDDKWGFLAVNRNYVGPRFDEIRPFAGGLFAVRQSRGWRFMDAQGNYVTEFQFDRVKPFAEGLIAVAQGRKWGLMDVQGNYVFEPQFDGIEPFAEGLVAVAQDSKWGVMDMKGAYVIEPQFSGIRPLAAEWTAVEIPRAIKAWSFWGIIGGGEKMQDMWGVIDAKGNYIIEPQFLEIRPLSAGWIAVQSVHLRKPWWVLGFGGGIMDEEGNYIVRFDDMIRPAAEDREFWDEVWGIMDGKGHYIFEPQFDQIRPFAAGIAAISIPAARIGPGPPGYKWGLVDRKGHYIFEPQFDAVGELHSIY